MGGTITRRSRATERGVALRTRSRLGIAVLLLAWAGTVPAQAQPEAIDGRIEFGGKFSVISPAESGLRPAPTPGHFLMEFGQAGHSLVVTLAAGPSGIGKDDIAALSGPDGGNRLVKLVTSFMMRAWGAHGTGLTDRRFETVEFRKETGKGFNIEPFFCACSQIRVRDLGARIEGEPTVMRMVAYACIDLKDMMTAAHVAYSERGREKDLSDQAFAEGERIARSLRRLP